jgi:hypothetical protein
LTRQPAREPAPVVAFPGKVGAPGPDGTVRVALAANQAECELIQGMLQTAGIPSTWRRTGGDLPGLLSAGYREVYVPASAAGDAQALMSTSELPGPSPAEPRRRKVGLERSGVRLIGKATAVVVLIGGVPFAVIGESTIAVVAGCAALLIAIAAIVAWSERASSHS